jgi:hypothetical protein
LTLLLNIYDKKASKYQLYSVYDKNATNCQSRLVYALILEYPSTAQLKDMTEAMSKCYMTSIDQHTTSITICQQQT